MYRFRSLGVWGLEGFVVIFRSAVLGFGMLGFEGMRASVVRD